MIFLVDFNLILFFFVPQAFHRRIHLRVEPEGPEQAQAHERHHGHAPDHRERGRQDLRDTEEVSVECLFIM